LFWPLARLVKKIFSQEFNQSKNSGARFSVVPQLAERMNPKGMTLRHNIFQAGIFRAIAAAGTGSTRLTLLEF
jgi:hypothetical protein